MAPNRALQNILETQKVGGGIFEISPTSESGGSVPHLQIPPCSAALTVLTKMERATINEGIFLEIEVRALGE